MQDRTALYVRIPKAQAEQLDQAAYTLKRSKQDLVAGLLTSYGDVDTLRRERAVEQLVHLPPHALEVGEEVPL